MAGNASGSNTSRNTSLAVSFLKSQTGDRLTDEALREIAKRLVIQEKAQVEGPVIYSKTAPTDKNKLWVELDASGQVAGITSAKLYDFSSGKWVSIVDQNPTPMNQEKQYTLTLEEGRSTIQKTDLPFLEGITTYSVNIEWLFDPGTDARLWLSQKEHNEITFEFDGIPVDGGDVIITCTKINNVESSE